MVAGTRIIGFRNVKKIAKAAIGTRDDKQWPTEGGALKDGCTGVTDASGSSRGHPPRGKVLLIGCARLWAATATSGTWGACVVSADQAPRRARSMGARGSGIFNGVTQTKCATILLNCDT